MPHPRHAEHVALLEGSCEAAQAEGGHWKGEFEQLQDSIEELHSMREGGDEAWAASEVPPWG